MRKWAEIYNTKVIGVHNLPDDMTPEFNPSSMRYLVEVTNIEPQPEPNWNYDVETNTFSVPNTVYINQISSKEYYLRLTDGEREAFISSVDNKVKQFSYWLTLSGDVDLNEAKIITATNYLENEGIIGVGRADIILTIEEA